MDTSVFLTSPLFRGFTENDIRAVLSKVPNQVKKYKSGSMIVQSGEIVRALIIVLNGSVKGEMVDFGGRVIKIEDIPAPGSLASAFIFGHNNRFPVNVIAVSDTELLIIEKHHFISLLKSEEKLMINFLDTMSDRSQFLSEKIRFLNFKTLKVKLAQYILKQAGNEDNVIYLKMTQSELSDFFGVARPSVARTIREMEDAGLIKAERNKITILKRKLLSEISVE
jgi:CRP/FNR family transcriptional regulator, dissimilatory nitrate respiration regulator